MTGQSPRPRWWFLITPRWLAWHTFAVLAAWGMLWLGDWQFHRAEGGNTLSWAYTFEWPIFTLFGVVFWAKTIIDEYRKPDQPTAEAAGPGAAHDLVGLPETRGTAAPPPDYEGEPDDPELAAYNAYLAKLNSRPSSR